MKNIQWNQILSDILNGKLKSIQIPTRKSAPGSESEEREIGDHDESDSEIENPDTCERKGCKPITTNPEDEMKLYTDGEMHTGENKNEKTNNRKYFHKKVKSGK